MPPLWLVVGDESISFDGKRTPTWSTFARAGLPRHPRGWSVCLADGVIFHVWVNQSANRERREWDILNVPTGDGNWSGRVSENLSPHDVILAGFNRATTYGSCSVVSPDAWSGSKSTSSSVASCGPTLVSSSVSLGQGHTRHSRVTHLNCLPAVQ